MAVTNKDSQKLTANPVTDVSLDAPSSEASKVSPEAAILFNKSIVAKPLMAPEVSSIHIKNTDYRYRWVNRTAQSGMVYMQRKAMGFMNATKDDVEILAGDAEEHDGEIRAGDLVLMKIRCELYDAALKYNMQKAYKLQRARGVYFESASSDVYSDSTAQRQTVSEEPFSRTSKAKAFIPESADSIINDSIQSGRVEEARKKIEQLRQQHGA